MVREVDCSLIGRRGQGLAAGRAARIGFWFCCRRRQRGSGSGSAAGKTAQLLSGLVLVVDRLNEEVKQDRVQVLPQANQRSRCRYSSGSILSRSGSSVRSAKVYSHSARPSPNSEFRDRSSVWPFEVRIEVRRRLTSSAATDEEELGIMSRHGTATKWDVISHGYGWPKD